MVIEYPSTSQIKANTKDYSQCYLALDKHYTCHKHTQIVLQLNMNKVSSKRLLALLSAMIK